MFPREKKSIDLVIIDIPVIWIKKPLKFLNDIIHFWTRLYLLENTGNTLPPFPVFSQMPTDGRMISSHAYSWAVNYQVKFKFVLVKVGAEKT